MSRRGSSAKGRRRRRAGPARRQPRDARRSAKNARVNGRRMTTQQELAHKGSLSRGFDPRATIDVSVESSLTRPSGFSPPEVIKAAKPAKAG